LPKMRYAEFADANRAVRPICQPGPVERGVAYRWPVALFSNETRSSGEPMRGDSPVVRGVLHVDVG
jgi:hypothetical protein